MALWEGGHPSWVRATWNISEWADRADLDFQKGFLRFFVCLWFLTGMSPQSWSGVAWKAPGTRLSQTTKRNSLELVRFDGRRGWLEQHRHRNQHLWTRINGEPSYHRYSNEGKESWNTLIWIHEDQVQLLARHRTPRQSHPIPESLVQALASHKANTCTTNSPHRLTVHMFLWQIQAETVIITCQWYG